MVSSLSPFIYFVLEPAIWPAGALGGGLFVYADRVTQVKRGVRGKPGGPTFSTPLVALKAQASYPDACHKSFQGGDSGRFDEAFDGVRRPCAHTTNSRAKFELPVNNRNLQGIFQPWVEQLNFSGSTLAALQPPLPPVMTWIETVAKTRTRVRFATNKARQVIRAGLVHSPLNT